VALEHSEGPVPGYFSSSLLAGRRPAGIAYSQDLRDRVVDAVVVEGMSRRGAAARFGVSETAAINWVKRVLATGSRTPAQLGGYKPMMLAPHPGGRLARRMRKLLRKLRLCA
jgi:transposase